MNTPESGMLSHHESTINLFSTEFDEVSTRSSAQSRTSYGFLIFDHSFTKILCCHQRFSHRIRRLIYLMRIRATRADIISAIRKLSPQELKSIESWDTFVRMVTGIYRLKSMDIIASNRITRPKIGQSPLMRKYDAMRDATCRQHKYLLKLIRLIRTIDSLEPSPTNRSEICQDRTEDRDWGPPKGGPLPYPMIESCIGVAVRETLEETKLLPSEYICISDIPPVVYSYESSDSNSYVFNTVLFTGVIGGAAEKRFAAQDLNQSRVSEDGEIDIVDFIPISSIRQYLPVEYVEMLANSVEKISKMLMFTLSGN